jgi:hypothetical protein
MPRFELFRIKTRVPRQRSLLIGDMSPASLLRAAVEERPSAELRKGHIWHMGNIETLDSTSTYFALGRTTGAMVERFDEVSRNFVEEQFDTAPYTHVVLDYMLGVAAVAAKPRLGPTVPGIARQLEKLLNESQSASQLQVSFEVAPISDPNDFISQLKDAYSVTQFEITVSLPNPFDVEEDFHAPFERLVRETNGTRGKASLTGPNLDPNVLESLARSAAATGEDAGAKITTREGLEPVKRHLHGDPASLQTDDVEDREDRVRLIDRVRSLYARIRRTAGGDEV